MSGFLDRSYAKFDLFSLREKFRERLSRLIEDYVMLALGCMSLAAQAIYSDPIMSSVCVYSVCFLFSHIFIALDPHAFERNRARR